MRKFVLLIFIFVSYLIFRPILADVWYPMHDTTSVARTYLLAHALESGQIPAVWAGELNHGQGYPLFHFYAPAMTYLALLGKTITGSYFMGIKIVLILSSLMGMFGMYLLCRRWGRWEGVLAAISYALLPYAALNLFVRGAYAEYLSMAILPWLFYAWRDLTTARQQVFATLVTALFILSHNLIPLITAPFLLVWIILNRPAKLRQLVLPFILTLGVCAFYLAPLLFERGFVQADVVARTTDYAQHFVVPTQLWNSTWGFGGSDIGVEDGMSFKVGKIQLLLAGLATISLVFKRPKRELYFVLAALVATFMTSSYSTVLWQHLPYLSLVQFPWRFLVLVGLFVSILSGYSLTLIHNTHFKLFVCCFFLLALLAINLKLFAPQTTFPADLAHFTSVDYLDTLPQIVPEYRPVWLDTLNPVVPGSTVLPYAYYPTWQVTLGGVSVATYPSEGGFLAFSNPSHSANFTPRQSHTLLETISTLISLVTLVVLLVLSKLYVQT